MTTPTTFRAFEMAASLLLATLLLAGGALAAGRVLRRRGGSGGGPDARSLLYRATLCASTFSVLLVLAALVIARPAPLLRVPLPAPSAQMIVPAPAAVIEPAVAPLPVPAVLETVPALDARRPAGFGIGAILLAVWLAGTVALLGRLLVAHGHLRRLRKRAEENRAPEKEVLRAELAACAARSGVAVPPPLLISSHAGSPFLAGVVRPVLFVPAGFAQAFYSAARRAIFAHELAHLRRRDCAWNLLARVVCALIWPQPLLWLVARRLEEANEEACDAVVVQAASDLANGRRAYADCLMRLAEASPRNRQRGLIPLGGAGVAPAFRSSLGRRVEHILKGPETMKSVSLPARVCVAVFAAVLATASVFLVSFSGPAPSRAAAQTPAAEPTPVLVTLKVDDVPLREFLDKLFEQAQPAGITYTVQGDLPSTKMSVEVRGTSLDQALGMALKMMQPPFTFTRDGNVYTIKPKPLQTVSANAPGGARETDLRRLLTTVFKQNGVRYQIDDDVRGRVVGGPITFHDLDDGLFKIMAATATRQITRVTGPERPLPDGPTVPTIVWLRDGPTYQMPNGTTGWTYHVQRAVTPPRPRPQPRVTLNVTNADVAEVCKTLTRQAGLQVNDIYIQKPSRVTIRLENVPLEDALTQICRKASPELTWVWGPWQANWMYAVKTPGVKYP